MSVPPISHKKRVVVLGAGFGGLTFCQAFDCPQADITLVDRQNHHLFQPLLYQVATAGLAAPDIAQPIRSILRRRRNVRVLLGEITGVDLARREVRLGASTLPYDYLVLALGSVTSYFGHPEWERYAPGLKTLDDALRLRRQILLAFERAESGVEPAERERLMTLVVVGGGPTGVELAGALAELTRRVLRRDFRCIDPSHARVMLIESGPRLLRHFAPRLSEKAAAQLARLGVELRTHTRVEEIREGVVRLAGGETIATSNVIWAAGVEAHPLTRTLGVEVDSVGRIRVRPDLSVPGHPEVFAIGDLALAHGPDGRPVPGVAPAAMQMARHVARLLEAECRAGRFPMPNRPEFRYRDRGMMATIGRAAAVAQIGRFSFSGWPAWLAWLLVHLIFLIGFRNKLAVLLQWTYAYFTYKLGSRIIFGTDCGSVSPVGRPAAPPGRQGGGGETERAGEGG